MKEKRLVDANHFMQVLKNIEYALKGELTHGKIKTSVVQMIEGSLNAELAFGQSLSGCFFNDPDGVARGDAARGCAHELRGEVPVHATDRFGPRNALDFGERRNRNHSRKRRSISLTVL